jgi:hypothetical protein
MATAAACNCTCTPGFTLSGAPVGPLNNTQDGNPNAWWKYPLWAARVNADTPPRPSYLTFRVSPSAAAGVANGSVVDVTFGTSWNGADIGTRNPDGTYNFAKYGETATFQPTTQTITWSKSVGNPWFPVFQGATCANCTGCTGTGCSTSCPSGTSCLASAGGGSSGTGGGCATGFSCQANNNDRYMSDGTSLCTTMSCCASDIP